MILKLFIFIPKNKKWNKDDIFSYLILYDILINDSQEKTLK